MQSSLPPLLCHYFPFKSQLHVAPWPGLPAPGSMSWSDHWDCYPQQFPGPCQSRRSDDAAQDAGSASKWCQHPKQASNWLNRNHLFIRWVDLKLLKTLKTSFPSCIHLEFYWHRVSDISALHTIMFCWFNPLHCQIDCQLIFRSLF